MAVHLEAAHVALSLVFLAVLVSNCCIGSFSWCGSSHSKVHLLAKNCRSRSLLRSIQYRAPPLTPVQEL